MAIHQKAVCYGQIIFLKISTSLWNSKLTSMENIIVGSILGNQKTNLSDDRIRLILEEASRTNR